MCIKRNMLTHNMFGCALISIFHTPGLDTPLQQDMATITEFIQPTGWVVKDVPRDSNSMFSAVVRQLSQADYDCAIEHSQYTADTLRQAVEDHLLENPYEDDADHTRHL